MADDMGGSGMSNFGFQFSVAGAVIMLVLYILQITDTLPFFLAPTTTLAVAVVAAVGAVLFYFGGRM